MANPEDHVNAWLLRMATTVLSSIDGDHLALITDLNSIADTLEGDSSDTISASPTEDDWLPEVRSSNGWDDLTGPSIEDLEDKVIAANWSNLSDNYIASLSNFVERGLTIKELMSLVDYSGDKGWNYFCGCCWNKIKTN